jgi:hypothetical protein
VAKYVAAPRYSISTIAAPSIAGTTTGGGTYKPGDAVTVSAIPAAGYKFVSWTINSGFIPTVVSTNPVYSFGASGSLTLTANFVVGAPTSFVVGLSENSPAGVLTGAGTYPSGAPVTVTASPAADWSFVGWYDSTNQLTQATSYSFTVSSNRVLNAVFQPTLTIASETADSVKLAWPATANGFVLQHASGLPSGPWVNVNAVPVVSGNANEIIVSTDQGADFFRVVQP